jgi:hypothetical protein
MTEKQEKDFYFPLWNRACRANAWRMQKGRSNREKEEFKKLLYKFLALPGELGCKFFWYEEVIQVIPYLPPGTPFVKLSSASYSAQARTRLYIGNAPCPAPGDSTALLKDCLGPGPHRISHRIFGKRLPSRTGKHHTTFQPFWACHDKTDTEFV